MNKIIELMIVVLVCGATWFLFKLFAEAVGVPPIAITVVAVLACVVAAVYILRFMGSLMSGGNPPPAV